MRPMLAVRGTCLPEGDGWCHEVKWDGIRALTTVGEPQAQMRTRNGRDVTASFPEFSRLVVRASGRRVTCELDGEIVVLEGGLRSFSAVASRLKGGGMRAGSVQHPAVLIVFDLLALDGEDLTPRPLRQRRDALETLTFEEAPVQLSPVHADGDLLLDVTRAQGLEGVVSKRWSAPYRPGIRSEDWLKFPHRGRSTWVVGGWTEQDGGAGRLASLLVGEPSGDGLQYRGKVGTGFSSRIAAALSDQLRRLETSTCPFLDPELARGRAARWVRPVLVVEVEALGRTPSGKLRQPSFVALREDLPLDEVPGV